MKLDVAGAFHSPLMEPAAEGLRAALAATPIAEPAFPVWSNGSAAPFTDIRRELSENLLRPVRWRETLLALHAAGAGEDVEVGPGRGRADGAGARAVGDGQADAGRGAGVSGRAAIVGVGAALPDEVVTNADLVERLDT